MGLYWEDNWNGSFKILRPWNVQIDSFYKLGKTKNRKISNKKLSISNFWKTSARFKNHLCSSNFFNFYTGMRSLKANGTMTMIKKTRNYTQHIEWQQCALSALIVFCACLSRRLRLYTIVVQRVSLCTTLWKIISKV